VRAKSSESEAKNLRNVQRLNQRAHARGESVATSSARIGPALIFQRLWEACPVDRVLSVLLKDRRYEFPVERAIFLTVLHRLFAPGSDRAAEKWKDDYSAGTLFSGLDLVFFDTTSIYFHGEGGDTIGRRGHSKDHRPDLKQMVAGMVPDQNGNPVCSELWPGNTADVKSLVPIVERLKIRFGIQSVCIVADRE
jgi:hypothetical protein